MKSIIVALAITGMLPVCAARAEDVPLVLEGKIPLGEVRAPRGQAAKLGDFRGRLG